jgi:hypothetical protein
VVSPDAGDSVSGGIGHIVPAVDDVQVGAVPEEFYIFTGPYAKVVTIGIVHAPDVVYADAVAAVPPVEDFVAPDTCGYTFIVIDAPVVASPYLVVAVGKEINLIAPYNAVVMAVIDICTAVDEAYVIAVPKVLPVLQAGDFRAVHSVAMVAGNVIAAMLGRPLLRRPLVSMLRRSVVLLNVKHSSVLCI